VRRGALGAAILALGLATAAAAGEPPSPIDAIREALAQVHRTDCKTRAIADIFDYPEMARRALGRHWRDRTEAERAQLVELLQGHVLTWYSRFCERRDFVQLGTAVVDGDRAVLSATAIREGRAVAIVYRLQSPDAKRWLVYDVEIAGRSHVRALYAELDRILLNEGYRDLVARLSAERETPRTAKSP
jgi:phospholipid transport system substrate-binding protein